MKYADAGEALRNATIFAQNASFPLNYCTDSLQQIAFYIEGQSEIYGSFKGFRKAALLNLFANAIRVQQIIKRLNELGSDTQEDVLAELYYTGVLCNILLVFERPPDAGDLEIDSIEDELQLE